MITFAYYIKRIQALSVFLSFFWEGNGNRFQAVNTFSKFQFSFAHLIFPDNINIRDALLINIATGKEFPEKVAENLIKAGKI